MSFLSTLTPIHSQPLNHTSTFLFLFLILSCFFWVDFIRLYHCKNMSLAEVLTNSCGTCDKYEAKVAGAINLGVYPATAHFLFFIYMKELSSTMGTEIFRWG